MEDEAIPYTLTSTSLKLGQNLAETTASERQRLFCGYGSEQRPVDRPFLSITKDPPANRQPYQAFFNVDSYIAFASSLAVAKHGLKVLTV